MDAHTIKKSLLNYRKNSLTIQRLNWKLEEISTKIYEGNTSSIIKLPEGTSEDRSAIISNFLVTRSKIQDEITHLSKEIEIVDEFLEKVSEHKDIIVDKYVNGLTNAEMYVKYVYDRQSIKRKIDEQISLYSD